MDELGVPPFMETPKFDTTSWMRDCNLSFGHVILPVEQVLMGCVCLWLAVRAFEIQTHLYKIPKK